MVQERARVLVRLEGIGWDSGFYFARLIIPQWSVDKEIRLPVTRIPDELRHDLQGGQRFIAIANLAATVPWELRLHFLGKAPDPDPEDGLA